MLFLGYLDWPPENYDSREEYARWAEVYNLIYGPGQKRDDLDFYLKCAQQYGDPILEIGCGTGRLMGEFVTAGYKIVGMDNSEEMLGAGTWQQNEELRRRITTVVGDMRDFSLDQKFNLIVLSFGTFAHLLTDQDRLKALHCIKTHLNPSGALAMDESVDLTRHDSEKLEVKAERVDPKTGLPVRMLSNYIRDKRRRCVCRYDYIDWLEEDCVVKRMILRASFRYSSAEETKALMESAGFNQIEVYGDFDGCPYDFEHSEKNKRRIFVSRV